jgi:hypothetical protein
MRDPYKLSLTLSAPAEEDLLVLLDKVTARTLGPVLTRLDQIQSTQQQILALLGQVEEGIMADLKALQDQVQQTTTVEQSAVTLIQGLATQLAANATDPAAIAQLAQQLKTSSDALAAAITANTPAANPLAPQPPL